MSKSSDRETFFSANSSFVGAFHNHDTSSGHSGKGNRSLLELLNIYEENIDTVSLSFDSLKRLIVTFHNGTSYQKKALAGKFCKRGFYEIYLVKKKKEIPPLIPILYGSRDIDRLRIALSPAQDLIISNKWIRDGNILFFTSGGRGRYKGQVKRFKSQRRERSSLF